MATWGKKVKGKWTEELFLVCSESGKKRIGSGELKGG